jgi:cellobiose-specific phosphotransferase system component IIA
MMMFCLYSAVFPCYSSMLAALKENKDSKNKRKTIKNLKQKNKSVTQDHHTHTKLMLGQIKKYV